MYILPVRGRNRYYFDFDAMHRTGGLRPSGAACGDNQIIIYGHGVGISLVGLGGSNSPSLHLFLEEVGTLTACLASSEQFIFPTDYIFLSIFALSHIEQLCNIRSYIQMIHLKHGLKRKYMIHIRKPQIIHICVQLC